MNAARERPEKLARRVTVVIGVALLAIAAIMAFANAWSAGYSVTPLDVLGGFVYFGLVWVLPAGLPAAAVGRRLAIRAMERAPAGRPLWFWAWRAVAAGVALGAAGNALWFAVMFLPEADHLRRTIGPASAIGAGAGAGVALITALYCWRLGPVSRAP